MAALKSQGATISRFDTVVSPNAYVEIPKVTSIGGPTGSAAVIPTTALDSTAVEKIMGLPDEGQVTLELIWQGETGNAVQVYLRTDRASQSLITFQIRLTDSPNSRYTFTAYVTNWELSVGVDSVTMVNITLEISGAVTASVS